MCHKAFGGPHKPCDTQGRTESVRWGGGNIINNFLNPQEGLLFAVFTLKVFLIKLIGDVYIYFRLSIIFFLFVYMGVSDSFLRVSLFINLFAP